MFIPDHLKGACGLYQYCTILIQPRIISIISELSERAMHGVLCEI